MNRVFADSFFFAILNPRDAAHAKAIDLGRRVQAGGGEDHG